MFVSGQGQCIPVDILKIEPILSFQTDIYTDAAELQIDPAPDTVIRVFMTFEASDYMIRILPQKLTAPERIGFTVVEWGGTEVQ